jgi:hypothetical protein
MNTRTDIWQLVSAIVIAIFLLLVAFAVGYYADQVDEVLGHGPLPSSVTGSEAYLITLFLALLSVVAGGMTVIGLSQTRGLTGRFYWLAQGLVLIILTLTLLIPLRRFGVEPWAGMPLFLVSVPTRMVLGVILGFVTLATLGPQFVPFAWRGKISSYGSGLVSAGVSGGGISGRFTPSAWRVLSYMQEEARRFEHGFMGTEHLLLAIVKEPQSLAARALVNLGGDLEEIRINLERILGRRGSLYTGGGGVTAKCRRSIEEAARFAGQMGNRTVGTGHLLRGLLVETEDAVSQLLARMGVSGEVVADELQRLGYETEEIA